MDEETANEVIMAARAHWFDGAGSRRQAERGVRRQARRDRQEAHHG